MTTDFWTDFINEGVAKPSLGDLVATLNPAQRVAVEKIEGPLLILAGPGSGKTRVITHRIAYMIASGIPSHQIIALTFTNKAANEMRTRLSSLAPDHLAWTGTFHKFCARTLRMHASMVGLAENFTIYDSGDSRKVLKQAIQNVEVDLKHYSADSMSQHVSNLKNKGVLASEFQPRPGVAHDAILARVYPEYQKLLKLANGVDFDDLLLYSVELLRDNPELRQAFDEKYAYFMVDEYQDTNSVQYKLIRLLNYNVQNLAVTGDPDQSIYGWRGADINNILRFEEDFPDVKIVRLEQNYRSTKSILRVADQLIENNLQRKHKNLRTENDEGQPVRLVAYITPQNEATDIADTIALALQKGTRSPSDYAIFYRTNWLSRALEHALRSAGVPYQVINGHEFYQRKEIKDVIAYLHLLNNSSDMVAFERVINVPPRKIGKVTLSRVRRFAMDHNITMLESARQCGDIETISKAPRAKITAFVEMYDRLVEASVGNVESVIKAVLDETGYRDWLTEDGSDEGFERARNVDELVVAAQEFDAEHPEDSHLEGYLEQTALMGDIDKWDSNAEYVTLMTLHASKGLEFPAVFLVGLEDGILPHERSTGDDDDVEEERRLMFVGITRAREELQISRCLTRFRRGSNWPSIASRFLMELPREEMNVFDPIPFGARGNMPSFEMKFMGQDSSDAIDESYEEPYERVIPISDDIDFDVEKLESEDDDQVREKIPATTPKDIESVKTTFPRLLTGSELEARLDEQDLIRTHPSAYQEGQEVEHAEYGVGRISQISGTASKLTATVEFPRLGRKRFRLAFSNLRILS